jgi:hypothetical protein
LPLDPLGDVGDLLGRRAVADAAALEADLDARIVERFGGALGPLRRNDLVAGATADEGRCAGSADVVFGGFAASASLRLRRNALVVFGGEVAVQRDDPAVGVGSLDKRREARDGALADTAGCNSFKIPWRYPGGYRPEPRLPDRAASRSYSRQYEAKQADPVGVEAVGVNGAVDELVDHIEAPAEPLGVRLAGVEAARREVRVVLGVAVGAHRPGRPHAKDVCFSGSRAPGGSRSRSLVPRS